MPDYIEEEGNYTNVEFELDIESLEDQYWIKKVKHRLGSIVMEFNYLEREIDDFILEIMNDRREDERVWIFMENIPSSKKIDILSKLYDNYFYISNFGTGLNKNLKIKKSKLFDTLNKIRLNRNVYIHSNWLNDFNGDFVEYKTKRLKSGGYGRIHKKISINDLDFDIKLIKNMQDELFEFHEEIVQEFFRSIKP